MKFMNVTKGSLLLCSVMLCNAIRILARRDSLGDRTDPWSGGKQNGPHQGNAPWMDAVHGSHPNDPLYQISEGAVGDSDELRESIPSEPTEPGPDHHDSNLGTTESPKSAREGECPICYLRREEAKRMRLEYIKRTILDRLGMDRPPNVSANIVLPKNADLSRLMDEYLSSDTEGSFQNDQPQSSLDRTPTAELHQTILFPKKPPPHWEIDGNTSFAFTFSEKLHDYDVQAAMLHIHIHGRRMREPSSAYYVLVKTLHEPPSGSLTPKIKVVIRKKVYLRPPKGQWVSLNLTDLVQEWFDYQEEHNVIQLSLVDVNNNPHNELLDTNTDSSYRKRSFLMANVSERRYSRLRRWVEDTAICTERSPVTSCCRYPMVVDFEEMEWDWVIAPRRYEANICQGTCPRMQLLSGGYSHILSAVSDSVMNVLCCTPDRMKGLNMIFIDKSENINILIVANMTVESCRCT